MPVLRLFNAETAHRLAILATKYHLTPRFVFQFFHLYPFLKLNFIEI